MWKYGEVQKKRKTQQIESIDKCYYWEKLPNGPLIEIINRLSNFEDLEFTRLVCSHWFFVSREYNCKFLEAAHVDHCSPHVVPWLMVVKNGSVKTDQRLFLKPCSSQGTTMQLFFYTLSFQRVRELAITLPPQLALGLDIEKGRFKNCHLFSSRGWLLVIREKSTMCLYNPFCSPSHSYISLPGPESMARNVKRFSLSASPCTKSYTVTIVYEARKVAFWKPGDEGWTLVEALKRTWFCSTILDVTFYRGYYYAYSNLRLISRIYSPKVVGHLEKQRFDDDVEAEAEVGQKFSWEPITTLFPSEGPFNCRAYFVAIESSGKLLLVVRDPLYPGLNWHSDRDHLTAGFRVLEIVVPLTGSILVKEVETLGNLSLFVGYNQGFAVEMPQEGVNVNSTYYGCKPNCIYFTDDRFPRKSSSEWDHGKDIGLYNMADSSIEWHFQGQSTDDYPPMLWVEPRC